MWHNHGSFPISFYRVDEALKDQTAGVIENLNIQISTVNFIFNFIKENSKLKILIIFRYSGCL